MIIWLFAFRSLFCCSKSLQANWNTYEKKKKSANLDSGDIKNWDLSRFLLWPTDPKILGPKQPNVSSYKKASCQMLEQLMAQMTEVAICFGQLSFSERVPRRTAGRRQMAAGGCSGCPRATGTRQGLGGCCRFPERYQPGEVGFKSEPLKSIQLNMNEFEARYNNYCCEGTAAAKLASRRTSKYPNH